MPDRTVFRVGKRTYRARAIGVEDARLVCRLLLVASPHLRLLMPTQKVADEGLVYVESLGGAVRKVPQAEQAWIGSTCLSSLERRVGLRWRPVWDARQHRFLCSDLSEVDYFLLVLRVVHDVAAEYLNESVPA